MSVTWTQPPKAVSPLLRVSRWTALVCGVFWARKHYKFYQKEAIYLDFRIRNKRFLKEHMLMEYKWDQYCGLMNNLAFTLNMPYRIHNTAENKEKYGFFVKRAPFFATAGYEDPFKDDIEGAYWAAGIKKVEFWHPPQVEAERRKAQEEK